MNAYNSMEEKGEKGKSASDGFREGGKAPEKAKAPSYKDTYNPNATVPKLPQIRGAE